ncbi:hypothetical protein EV182_000534 [Spiromyces aspiralis]|uniref:Uncharacterized protein n=1 Tax=Spiromyces aspiralis TaxID=68401 RepID=A0ACC1HUD1_9FUNG|nr:hypothetical protein EV182_000534 [Spiromyces aspiralis]
MSSTTPSAEYTAIITKDLDAELGGVYSGLLLTLPADTICILDETERQFHASPYTRMPCENCVIMKRPYCLTIQQREALIFIVNLPGVHRNAIELRVTGGKLHLSAEAHMNAHHMEINGVYARNYILRYLLVERLPMGIGIGGIRSRIRDGMLVVTLPIRPQVPLTLTVF